MEAYAVVNGTSYSKGTPQEVIDVMESCRINRVRVVLDYGKDGQSWGEVYDVTGYIGRSTGNIKIPILVHNSRSLGGGGILDSSIVQIKTSKGKRILYQHPNYKPFQP